MLFQTIHIIMGCILGAIGDPRAVDPLILGLKDEESDVRWRAAHALGEIGDDRAVDPLIGALKDEGSVVENGRWWALGSIGDMKAIDVLTDMALNDENESVREAAAEALKKIGGE